MPVPRGAPNGMLARNSRFPLLSLKSGCLTPDRFLVEQGSDLYYDPTQLLEAARTVAAEGHPEQGSAAGQRPDSAVTLQQQQHPVTGLHRHSMQLHRPGECAGNPVASTMSKTRLRYN